MEVGPAHVELFAVAHGRLRSDDDPRTAQVGTPAQVDVVAVERHRGVEPPEGAEQVGPREEAGGREDEHVADGVVLLLVVLARLGDRLDLAEPVEAQPDVLEHARVVPRDELGTDDPGVRAVQLLDEQAHGVRVEGHVVVAEAEEAAVALDEPQHLVGGRAKAGVGAEVADEGVGETCRDLALEVGDVTTRQQEKGAEVGVVLVGERVDRLVEPAARGVDDDDPDDRRRERRVGFHGAVRLSAPPLVKTCTRF